MAASQGGGAAGYSTAFLVIAVVALVLTVLSLGLKSRSQELATMQANAATQANADMAAKSTAQA